MEKDLAQLTEAVEREWEQAQKSMGKKKGQVLNVPMVGTAIFDLFIYGIYFYMCAVFGAGPRLSALKALVMINALLMLNTGRDMTMRNIMPEDVIPRAKREWKFKDELWGYIAKVDLVLVAIGASLAATGMAHMNSTGDLLKDYIKIVFTYWAMGLGKDLTSMKYVHKWMHKPENYHWHATHHKAKDDIQLISTFYFDIPDLLIENGAGAPAGLLANYLVFGEFSIPFLSLLLVLQTDGNLHSVNPYSWTMPLMPGLDIFMKPTLTHSLHHAIENGYFEVYPLNHLTNPRKLAVDTKLYNKLHGTDISYDLFRAPHKLVGDDLAASEPEADQEEELTDEGVSEDGALSDSSLKKEN